MESSFKERIDNLIEEHKIVLFMKGYKHQPMCGFSARVVSLLNEMGVDYHTENIFDDPDLRSGMKEYSSWPTFPQLYVDKEFVGGCDIVTGMFQSGDLHKLLNVEKEEVPLPSITITEAAVHAFKAALQRYDGEIHLEISPQFQYDIGVAPASPNDYAVESNGFTIYMNQSTAKRADGMTIDFQSGGGVVIDNPNEPTSVRQINVRDLRHWMDIKKDFVLFDVRGQDERAIAKIEEAILFTEEELDALDKNRTIVFHCHHGMRSQRAALVAIEKGFRQVYNVQGGIHAWSQYIDPEVKIY
ncbi:MAG: Grx4 family monothiol glutaredoxin [Myxococcota bacterium]|nr:Grx4 family monothiol glutaredoxin [Myxococcota bacterium]